MGEQVFDQRQAGGIDPLHVVQEQDQRMFLAAERGHELSEHHAEAVLCLARWQRRYGRLRADNQLDLGQHIDNQLAIDPNRGQDLLPPVGDARLAFGQQLLHQCAKRLREGGIGNIALVLIELAGNEIAMLRDNWPV